MAEYRPASGDPQPVGPIPPRDGGLPTAGAYQYTVVQPPSRSRRFAPWVIGCLGAAALVCIALIVLGAIFGPRLIRGSVEAFRESGAAVTGYYDAVEAHDWQRAHSYLDSRLRSQTSVEELQADWERREAAYGAVDRFNITGTNVRTSTGVGTTATINGTLHYKTGHTEPKVIALRKDGDDWRLTSLP